MTDIHARQQLFVTATMVLPKMLPDRLKLVGINQLFVDLGGKEEWLDRKGGARLWETDKAQRVREWLEAFATYDSKRLLPVILETLKILAASSPQLTERDAKSVNYLAEQIELMLGYRTTRPPQYVFDPRIWGVIQLQWQSGDYANAVRQAYVQLINEVKLKAGTHGLDGEDLMNKVFSEQKPILRVSEDPNVQRGTMNLFKGAVAAIRNPPSHSNQLTMTQQEANELVWFANHLLRIVDHSKKIEP